MAGGPDRAYGETVRPGVASPAGARADLQAVHAEALDIIKHVDVRPINPPLRWFDSDRSRFLRPLALPAVARGDVGSWSDRGPRVHNASSAIVERLFCALVLSAT